MFFFSGKEEVRFFLLDIYYTFWSDCIFIIYIQLKKYMILANNILVNQFSLLKTIKNFVSFNFISQFQN